MAKVKRDVRNWQRVKHAVSFSRLMECEGEVGFLVNSLPPSFAADLDSCILYKRDLTIELHDLRAIED